MWGKWDVLGGGHRTLLQTLSQLIDGDREIEQDVGLGHSVQYQHPIPCPKTKPTPMHHHKLLWQKRHSCLVLPNYLVTFFLPLGKDVKRGKIM